MAKQDEEGTGKHPHKSTEEPYPHHEAPTTKGSESKGGSQGGSHGGSHSGGSHGGGQQSSGKSEEESSDLKSREYTDKEGNVHHHTRTYEEQHKGEKGEK